MTKPNPPYGGQRKSEPQNPKQRKDLLRRAEGGALGRNLPNSSARRGQDQVNTEQPTPNIESGIKRGWNRRGGREAALECGGLTPLSPAVRSIILPEMLAWADGFAYSTSHCNQRLGWTYVTCPITQKEKR